MKTAVPPAPLPARASHARTTSSVCAAFDMLRLMTLPRPAPSERQLSATVGSSPPDLPAPRSAPVFPDPNFLFGRRGCEAASYIATSDMSSAQCKKHH